MPDVNSVGSSAPPVSGRGEDPRQPDHAETVSHSRTFPEDAPDPGPPEQRSVVECLEADRSPDQLNAGGEKSSGDDGQASSQSRKREEAIKDISISSTAFIGPACRPQPEIEDELNEFYKELSQIDQPVTIDGNSERVAQSWAPPDAVDGNSERVAQSWAPPDAVDGNSERVAQSWAPPDAVDGNSERVPQSSAPSLNPPALKKKANDQRNAYGPYPATRPQTYYRNTPQWRPESHWSHPHSYQNQWQPSPPNFHFYPPPPTRIPTPLPFSQPQGHQYSRLENDGFQLGPDARLGSYPNPAPYAPYEAFERWQYEERYHRDVTQHGRSDGPSLELVLMRGVPGSGKSTLARQISSSGPSGLILSTDDYFYQKDGYLFEPTLLGAAHDWNQIRAENAMRDGRTPVIIDNTNAQAWEMKPYVAAALEMGYSVKFVEPETSWKCDPVELEKRNHHGVPRESIANMLDRFELPISVDIVMNSRVPSHKRKEHHSGPHRHRR